MRSEAVTIPSVHQLLTPDTKPHIVDTAMSLPVQPPSQPSQQPAPEPIAKIEYDRLIAYFDKLVKYSVLAITFILGMAGAFLWKNTDDVKNQAAAAIKATQDGATRAISDIGKSAQDTAKSEAQNAIDAAFEKQNIQKMIETAAQKKVEAAVDAQVQRKLGDKLDAARVLTIKLAQVNSHGAMVLLESRAGLDEFRKDQEDPDPTVKAFAASTLKQIGADYERGLALRTGASEMADPTFLFFPRYQLKDLMGNIQHFQGPHAPEEVAKAFLDMKKRVQWNVPMFDIAAAERWCAAHKPKCEE